jgi:hypothetical protein
MNERIRQLAEQCTTIYNSTTFPVDKDFDYEKFAELIVRECIERVRSQCIHVRDSTIEGRPNPFFPDLRVRTEYEQGIVKCGVDSVIALEELIQESTDRWHKENILGDEE